MISDIKTGIINVNLMLLKPWNVRYNVRGFQGPLLNKLLSECSFTEGFFNHQYSGYVW